MAKFRRSYVRRRRTRKSYGRKLARGTPRRKSSIGRRLAKLERANRQLMPKLLTQYNANFNMISDVTSICLTKFAQQGLIFGADASDATTANAKLSNFSLDIRLAMNNEPANVTHTIFLVSLKDAIGDSFSAVNGDLNLLPGTHYVIKDGMAMVNKEFFNIHKIKRCSTGNNNAVINQGVQGYGLVSNQPSDTRVSMRWHWKQLVGKVVRNPTGNWKALACGRDPSLNYYLLCFNDNNPLDFEHPIMQLNQVSSYRTF